MPALIRFFLKRLALGIITLFLLSITVFAIAHLLPGDVGRAVLGPFSDQHSVDILNHKLGVDRPILQAGMGGGLSRHELAAAVSEAGGLGTIAVSSAAAIGRELAAARALTGRPIAVNLLLPFARRDWFVAAAGADVVVTFWGKPKRRTPPKTRATGAIGGATSYPRSCSGAATPSYAA